MSRVRRLVASCVDPAGGRMAACSGGVLLGLTLLALCGCPAPHGATVTVPAPGVCSGRSSRGLHESTHPAAVDRADGVAPARVLHGLLRLRGGRYRAERDTLCHTPKVQPKRKGKRGGGTAGNDAGLKDRDTESSSKVSALKEALRARLGARQQQAEEEAMGVPPEDAHASAEQEGSGDRKKHRPGSFQALGLDNTLLRGMYHAGMPYM